MPEELTITAKTVEQGLAMAAKQLNSNVAKLEYEVLDQKKSFTGRSKSVKLSVWLPQQPEKATTSLPPAEDLDGKIDIQDGKVCVSDPKPGGRPAVILPADHVTVHVNDQSIEQPTEVFAADKITVAADVVPDQSELFFDLSQDRMSATVKLKIIPGCRYRVCDAKESSQLTVQSEVAEIQREPLSEEKLREQIREANITFGIKQEALQKLLNTNESCQILIAEGRPGKEPIDEKLTILYDEKQSFDDNQLRVDFRERGEIICVQEGDLLAEILPGREGQSRIDVTGKEYKTRPPARIKLRAGKGVQKSSDELRYLATQEGQPVLQNNVLQVLSVYQTKAVNMSTGNVHFSGDVFVNNNVEENMLVDAKGEVKILGSVNMAQVQAGANITVQHSVIGSRLQAGGGKAAMRQTILTYLNDLSPVLEQLTKNLKVAWQTYQDKGMGDKVNEGQLLKLLIEKMFPQLDHMIANMIQYAFDGKKELDGAVQDLLTDYKTKLTGVGPVSQTSDDLADLHGQTQALIHTLQQAVENTANVTLGYAQNSTVETSGDIVVTGKGSYNTTLAAGHDVKITGGPGVFRGGQIVSGGHVTVGEIGSPAEVSTVVSVSRQGRIRARIVYPNVTIKVGNFSEKIKEKTGGYEARLGPNGLTGTGHPL